MKEEQKIIQMLIAIIFTLVSWSNVETKTQTTFNTLIHIAATKQTNTNSHIVNNTEPTQGNTTLPTTNLTAPKHTAIVCRRKNKIQNQILQTNASCYSAADALKCFHDPIFCEKHFLSGKRDLLQERPTYGEYSYLTHQQWFRVIQHGGIAFLFHPCADDKEIQNLRNLASQCLHRYILAPYEKLTDDAPIALVSWGCYYLSSHVNQTSMKKWIQTHVFKGPASHVHTNGKFQKNLVKLAKVITDVKDVIVCPSFDEVKMFTTKPLITGKYSKHVHDRIINNRLEKYMHKRDKPDINISANITLKKVSTTSAAWAAGSLIFVCGLLIGLLLYTKMWTRDENSYKYDRLSNLNAEFECDPAHSEFSLLKSSQKFMSIFRTNEKRERKLDSMSRVNLMVPINEEEEDDETIFQR